MTPSSVLPSPRVIAALRFRWRLAPKSLILFVLAAVLLPSIGVHAGDVPNDKCLECHEDKDLNKTNAQGKVVSLFVDQARFAASAHKGLKCSDCHSDLTLQHPDNNIAPKPVQCISCHQKQS